uniref:LIM zinc-binding domain-containing protein n=1 Tax=Globodera pallida TaxID=36090 RepID=A0A183C2Q4_GLOPA
MASTKCAREDCGKTVYPLEELKCLDKVWHKGCFKCTDCGMTLSMKSYKGYEKKPYCQAHYPKTVPSAVSETPEMELARKNTAYQSQVKYHEAYEKQMKGTKLEVADDPETKRHKANMMNQSLAHYHGELQKKEKQDSHRETAGSTPSAFSTGFAVCNSSSLDSLSSAMSNASSVVRTPPHNGSAYRHQQPPDSNYRNSSQQQHNNQQQQQAYSYGQLFADKDSSPYSQRIAQQAHGTVIYSSDWGGKVDAGAEKPVGSIADYDPMAAEKQQKGGTAAGGAACLSILLDIVFTFIAGRTTPKFNSDRSSGGRLATMSPAARTLLGDRLGIRLGTDRIKVSPSPRRVASRTIFSPAIYQMIKVKNEPKSGSTTPKRAAAGTPTLSSSSVTDDLLRIPSPGPSTFVKQIDGSEALQRKEESDGRQSAGKRPSAADFF